MSNRPNKDKRPASHVYENILVPAAEVNPKKFAENADLLVHLVRHDIIGGQLEALEVMSMCGVDYYKAGHITYDTSIVSCALCIWDYNLLVKKLKRVEDQELNDIVRETHAERGKEIVSKEKEMNREYKALLKMEEKKRGQHEPD
jgi:hypothetical protein